MKKTPVSSRFGPKSAPVKMVSFRTGPCGTFDVGCEHVGDTLPISVYPIRGDKVIETQGMTVDEFTEECRHALDSCRKDHDGDAIFPVENVSLPAGIPFSPMECEKDGLSAFLTENDLHGIRAHYSSSSYEPGYGLRLEDYGSFDDLSTGTPMPGLKSRPSSPESTFGNQDSTNLPPDDVQDNVTDLFGGSVPISRGMPHDHVLFYFNF